MTDMKLTAADDLVVSLDYRVRLSGGEVVAASTPGDRKALEFLQGRGQILPTLEHALYGMATGDEKDVAINPTDGFGQRLPASLYFFSSVGSVRVKVVPT